MDWALAVAVSIIGLLTTGAGSALLRKGTFGITQGAATTPLTTVLFQMPALGLDGTLHTFKKPFFTTMDSALACTSALAFHWVYLWTQRRAVRQKAASAAQQPLLSTAKSVSDDDPVMLAALSFHPITQTLVTLLVWPALFGRLALIIQGMGLKYVSASMNQMVAASCIVFTAILSVTFLQRRLNRLHIGGILLVLVGIATVSFAHEIYNVIADLLGWAHVPVHAVPHTSTSDMAAGMLHKHHHHGPTRSEVALGIALILLSQLVQAGQLVLEEVLLAGKGALEPLEVIGWEGVLSIGWMLGVFLPMAQLLPGADVGGVLENTADSVVMLVNSPSLFAWNAIYLATVIGTNVFGLMVAAYLGSVFRAVLLAARTGLVWVAALAIHALGVGGGLYGEAWDVCSWVVLAGFVTLLTGTVMYAQGSSKVVKVQELHPEDGPEEVKERVGSYTLVSAARVRDDLGLFDDLVDRDAFDEQLAAVGHPAVAPQRMASILGTRASQEAAGTLPLQIAPSLRRGMSAVVDSSDRASLRGLWHSTSWIKDEEDRLVQQEIARRERVLKELGGLS